jgi:hypothetical protein
MQISRNEFRVVDDRRTISVPLPEYGTNVEITLKQMSGADRERYEAWAMAFNDQRAAGGPHLPQYLYARMAVLSCVDASGNPLFDESDVEWLSQKSYVTLRRIFDAAWKLNLLDPDEVDKAVNFLEITPSSRPGTDSASPSGDAPSPN